MNMHGGGGAADPGQGDGEKQDSVVVGGTLVVDFDTVAASRKASEDYQRKQLELFELWYARPIEHLKKLDGAGGFAALALGCILYNRYAQALKKQKQRKGSESDVAELQLMDDFCLDRCTAHEFWQVMRHGLTHGAMPQYRKRGKTHPWRLRGDFNQPIHLHKGAQGLELRVQPWLFADRVICLWRSAPQLIAEDLDFRWAAIL